MSFEDLIEEIKEEKSENVEIDGDPFFEDVQKMIELTMEKKLEPISELVEKLDEKVDKVSKFQKTKCKILEKKLKELKN